MCKIVLVTGDAFRKPNTPPPSPEAVEAEIAELTDLLNDPQKFDPQQADNQRKLLKLAQARLEVYRRTSVYN